MSRGGFRGKELTLSRDGYKGVHTLFLQQMWHTKLMKMDMGVHAYVKMERVRSFS